MGWREDVAGDTHALTWRARVLDPSWAGAGGPTEIWLDVMSVVVVQVYDRVPSTRITVTASPPRDGSGDLLLSWISPLHMTAQIEIWARYQDSEDSEHRLGVFQLRRRRMSWPMAGGVTLDCASWDGDAADRMTQAEDLADALTIEEG